MVDHDALPGILRRCQITGSADLSLIVDLGYQAPCDALLTRDQLDCPEVTYPLRLMHCEESGLAQLDYIVPGEEIYPPSYPYRSGISKPLEEYQRAFADSVVEMLGLQAFSFVVDVGSNDGTLLTGFKRNGMRVLGVEPTDMAKVARTENGIETEQAFFTEEQAKGIAAERGRAKVITMTNVFAHMAGLGEVMRGICALLDDDGVFITESHYLLDVLEKNQFDTVYHEHIRTYSLKSLRMLAYQYGLEVFRVSRASRYGGNIRAYIARAGSRQVDASVQDLMYLEAERGLHKAASWRAWLSRVLEQRDGLMEFLHQARRNGMQVVGKSCPGRAATLLNFYGVTPDLMPYLGELDASMKLGKYVPGCHIPVVSERRILDEQPECLVLLSWHYGEFIAKRLRAAGVRSRMFVPLPTFQEVAA